MIAGRRHKGLSAPWVIPGVMDRTPFNIYIEPNSPQPPGPATSFLDNLGVHKSAAAEATIRTRGAWMLFLALFARP